MDSREQTKEELVVGFLAYYREAEAERKQRQSMLDMEGIDDDEGLVYYWGFKSMWGIDSL